MATLTGLVDDQDILQNERVIDMDPAIAMLDPDVSQFTTMLMRVARSGADSTKVEWLEDELFPRLSSVASGGATNGATIVVAAGEGAFFRVGDIVRNARTGVAVRISSISTDTLTPTNALGRVAFAAHAAADQLLIVGNAAAQGATLGTRKVQKRVAQSIWAATLCKQGEQNQAICWNPLKPFPLTREQWKGCTWAISRKEQWASNTLRALRLGKDASSWQSKGSNEAESLERTKVAA